MYAQVVEYGTPTILPIDSVQATALRAAGARWAKTLRLRHDAFEVLITEGGYAIAARGIAGFVRVGNLSLDIVPKFLDPELAGPHWRRSLWRLLAFAQGVDSIVVTTSGQEVDERGIADLLADLFITSVDRASLMGYPLGYQRQRRLSQFLTGRIDLKRASRLATADGLLPIEANQLTRDTDLCRLLKWAGRELCRLVESSERRGRLGAWIGGLPEVSDRMPIKISGQTTPRRLPHLRVAIEIAQMLQVEHSSDYGDGALHLPGFLWRSETLFEKAMLRLARQCAHSLGMTADKKVHRLAALSVDGSEHTLTTTPDIDVHQAARSVVVLDAKYKILDKLPNVDDVYQVLSAGRVCNVYKAALLYPSMGLGLHSRSITPLGNGLPRVVDIVSIGFQSFESITEVRNLKSQLTDWLRESQRLQSTV